MYALTITAVNVLTAKEFVEEATYVYLFSSLPSALAAKERFVKYYDKVELSELSALEEIQRYKSIAQNYKQPEVE